MKCRWDWAEQENAEWQHSNSVGRYLLIAILMAAITGRARTILLTTVSACCGLIPFLAGGEAEVFWFAMGTGTLGGLVFSLIAVFVVLPVLLWRKKPA